MCMPLSRVHRPPQTIALTKRASLLRWQALLAVGCFVLACLKLQAAVRDEVWGEARGVPVRLYTLSNDALSVQLCEYGARIVSLQAPDRAGRAADVVLGYNNLEQYVQDPKDFFGAVVGRYGNRLAAGTFHLDGQTYHVPLNNKGNALHGGPQGFSTKIWKGMKVGDNAVEFILASPDGDMGFPGTLTAVVRYTLQGKRLRLDYTARTNKPTVVNLTNHSYFNLHGEGSGDVLQQRIQVFADRFTPVNATLIPTGQLMPVQGTPFDLRQSVAIGAHLGEAAEQLRLAGGYDHNFVLSGASRTLRKAAAAIDPASGRTLTVWTTEPGVQFYSGNFLAGQTVGYSGKAYQKHAGFCLETQHFPDSPNQPAFPSTVLRPGQEFHSLTVFEFGTQQ